MRRALALALVLVFMLTSCVGTFAANTANDPAQQQQPGARPGSNNSAASLNSAVNSLSSYYTNYFKNAMENKGATWLNNTSLDFAYGAQWNSFTYQFDTVQPLNGMDWMQKQNVPFVEASVFGNSNSDLTVNLGMGYRHLNDKKNILMGVNAFYDYGNFNNSFNANTLTYHSAGGNLSHQRVGLGLEYMQSYFEGYANYYLPISARQYLGQDQNKSGYQYYQEALSGYDVAISAAVPGATWLKGNLRGYQYYGNNTNNIVGSNSFMSGLDIGATAQIMPQLSVSGGYDTGSQGGYVKAAFNLLAMPVPALFGGDKTINDYAQYNLSNKMLNRVQRNNVITVANEKQAFNLGATTEVKIPVKDWNGQPAAGISCTLFDSAGTYSDTQLSNSSGNVVFKVPKTALPTGAVGDGEGVNSVWNFIARVYKFVQAGQDLDKGTWSPETITASLTINSNVGVIPETRPVITVAPQPTPQQVATGTRNPEQKPPENKTTYCQVSVVDDDGQPVPIRDNFKAVLLDPTKASSATKDNLPSAVILRNGEGGTTYDLSQGKIAFEAKLDPQCGGDDTEDSGAYGVAVIPDLDGNNTAYGNTVNLTAYAGGKVALEIKVKRVIPKRTVSITVRDLHGNLVPDGTYVRAGSTIDVMGNSYDPPAKTTVNGQVTFSEMKVDSKFYVLAYSQTFVNGQPQNRTVVAVGQFDGLNDQYPSGAIPLSVQQVPYNQ